MNGECEKCGEHCLGCKCKQDAFIVTKVFETSVNISIDKKYLRTRFSKVLENWNERFSEGVDEEDLEDLMDQLLKSI